MRPGLRPALRRDERGQMMLMAAFVFVIALLALSASLAKVPLLAKQTTREQDRSLLRHLDPLQEGIDGALADLAGDFVPGLQPGTVKFDAAVAALFEHLRAVEADQGYLLEWELECDTPGDPATARGHLSITDGAMWVRFQTRQVTLSACPP